MHRFALIVGTGLLCVGIAFASEPRGPRPKPSDAEGWAKIWEGADRDRWQKRNEVLTILAIQAGDRVADIGAGTGYFTRPLSIQVRSTGKVYAVDVEQAMLDHIRGRSDIHQQNVETVLAKPNDPRLPEASLDMVLTVNTWHHIKKRAAYAEKIRQSLKPDGRLVLIDFHEGDLPVGPPAGKKVARELAIEELTEAGWTLAAESVMLPYQYFLTFYPPLDEPLKLMADGTETLDAASD